MEDPAEPRARRGALAELVREDLELLAVSDLEDRISVLEAEIGRARDQITRKESGRSAADALFSFSKGP